MGSNTVSIPDGFPGVSVRDVKISDYLDNYSVKGAQNVETDASPDVCINLREDDLDAEQTRGGGAGAGGAGSDASHAAHGKPAAAAVLDYSFTAGAPLGVAVGAASGVAVGAASGLVSAVAADAGSAGRYKANTEKKSSPSGRPTVHMEYHDGKNVYKTTVEGDKVYRTVIDGDKVYKTTTVGGDGAMIVQCGSFNEMTVLSGGSPRNPSRARGAGGSATAQPSSKVKIIVPNGEPSPKQMQMVANAITKQWKALGRLLNVSDNELDVLEADERSSVTEMIYQMLRVWRERAGTNATVKCLAKALVDVGRVDVVEKHLKSDRPV